MTQVALTQSGTWIGYSGTARIVLAAVLLIGAAATLTAAFRVPLPVRPPRMGPPVAIAVVVAWVLSLIAFLVCASILVEQARRDDLPKSAPTNPITPVTLSLCAAIFLLVALLCRSYGWKERVIGGVLAALAAPMIFELPFDLVVMSRTYPPIPPDPVLYRVIIFVPLFAIEILTLSLLAVSRMVRLRRSTFVCFATMLAVFAVWGLFGFAYPATPLPIAMNVLGKVIAFATALSLFLPSNTARA